MRKIYQHFTIIFCFAAILTGCGTGLCPLRTSAGVCISGSNGWALAPLGILDTTFGTSGYVTTNFSASAGNIRKVILAPDSNLIAGGVGFDGVLDSFTLAKYLTTGVLDTSFGTGGSTQVNFGDVSYLRGLKLTNDNKILAVGYGWAGADNRLAFARFHSNGSLDTSFGASGLFLTALANSMSYGGIDFQSDFKIIAGMVDNGDSSVVRVNLNGTLDTTFGTAGKTTINIAAYEEVWDLSVLSNDKILVAGRVDFAGAQVGLFRLNSNGSIDTTFGTAGFVTYGVAGHEARSLVVLSNGDFVIGGRTSAPDFLIAKFKSDGSNDTSFGTGGATTVDFAGDSDYLNAIALQPDGKIIATGQVFVAGSARFGTLRLNSNGSLDTTFGTSGLVITNFPAANEGANSILLTTDGKLYIGGQIGAPASFGLARYR